MDRNNEKKNILFDGMLTRLLRFVGRSSHSRFCLRAEVYGVKFKPGTFTCEFKIVGDGGEKFHKKGNFKHRRYYSHSLILFNVSEFL